MARRHYGLDVEVLKIKGTDEYEAALFDGACDVIIEHLEYLYEQVAGRKKVSIFCAPSKGGSLELVVPAHVKSADDLKGGTMAVRPSGQPYAVTLWLRMMGFEADVKTVMVKDSEVGRWKQWKKVAAGECVAAFISPLYLPDALSAGLKVLPVPDIPIVGQYAQACLSQFARDHSALLKDYIKAVIHAVCLMKQSRAEALAIVAGEPMRRMNITSPPELERQFDAIANYLKPRLYPTPQAIANTYEIATLEYPGAVDVNPLSLWDLHWAKELDDEGFAETLMSDMATGAKLT
jgi:hypothetical protein